jgi:3-hydroxyacyl-CoA dehydrogenase
MIAAGLLGRKSGGGFYKRVKAPAGGAAGVQFWGLDFETLEYREPITPQFARLDQAAQIEDLEARITFLIEKDDRVGRLVWASVKNVLLYAAYTVPEISESLISVDRAMRWGYSWEMGPFELWDVLGFDRIVERIEAEGESVSDWVKGLLDTETRKFYSLKNGRKTQYLPTSGGYQLIPDDPRILPTSRLVRETGAYIEISPEARLFDLKDGVAHLQIDKELTVDGKAVHDTFNSALSRAEAEFDGVLVSKLENLTSAGVSIPMLIDLIRNQDFDSIGNSIDRMNELHLLIQSFAKPIVFAGIGQVTGAGTSIALSAASMSVDAEIRIGFEEAAYGLIPVAGGCKDLMQRAFEPLTHAPSLDPLQFLRHLFNLVFKAKVSNSAMEAREMGFLSERDDIVMNRDHVIRRAKDKVISLAALGVKTTPIERTAFVLGERGKAALGASIYLRHQSGYVSDYDKFIAEKLIHILSGGSLTSPQWVDGMYIVELEREAFLSLCGEEKTLARLEHNAKRGKRLKN